MAMFHMSVKAVQRSKGRSATASAAYRAAGKIHDDRLDTTYDFTRKRGVVHAGILAPTGEVVPARAALWNAAEKAERRKDGTTAREVEVSLPAELSAEQRQSLALAFARSLVERYQCAADVCIHAPGSKGDQRNHHAHIMLTTRKLEGGQLTSKTDFELSDRDRKKRDLPLRREELVLLRAAWADLANLALEKAGRPERIDPRSLADQGSELEPTIHQGPAATAMARRGEESERVRQNEQIRARNEIREELAQLEAIDKGTADIRQKMAQWKEARAAAAEAERKAQQEEARERVRAEIEHKVRAAQEKIALEQERRAAEQKQPRPARQQTSEPQFECGPGGKTR